MGLIGSGTTNECNVLTVFPLGVECNTTNPTTTTSLDGVVSIDITGGTAPYSIQWDNGATSQTLYGLGGGEYTATVTDYYGDFTSVTTCVIVQPTTTTTTYTPTTTVYYRRGRTFCLNLCKVGCDSYTFEGGNIINGYNSWTSSTMTVFYNTTNLRWELSGYTVPFGYTAGLIYSNNAPSVNPPLDWFTLGNNYRPNASAVEGECEIQEITIVRSITNSSCSSANDGTVVLIPTGVGPFLYSKNGGLTYQSSPVFADLSAGIYTMVVKDTSNDQTISNVVTITNQNTIRAFNLFINPITPVTNYTPPNSVYDIVQTSSQTKQIIPFTISPSPALVVGETLTFNFTFKTDTEFQSPGNASFTNNLLLYKNGTLLTGSVVTGTTTDSDCSGESTITNTSTVTYNAITLTYTDTLSGSVYSNTSLSATSSVLGCTSVAKNVVSFYPQNLTITPQKCRSVNSALGRITQITNNLQYINPPLNLTFSNRWLRSDESLLSGFTYDGNVNNPASPGISPKIAYNFTKGCLSENISCFPTANTVQGGPIYVSGQNQVNIQQGARGSDINLWLKLGGIVSGGSCFTILGTLRVSVNGGGYTTLATLNGSSGVCSRTYTYTIPLNANTVEFVWEQTRI